MSKFLEHQRVDRGLRGLILAEFEICFGKKNIEFIIQHLNTKFNLKLSVDAYKNLLRDKEYAVDISYFSGVCEAITKLLELGFTIRLLTNGGFNFGSKFVFDPRPLKLGWSANQRLYVNVMFNLPA
jgi:hypothetical protein